MKAVTTHLPSNLVATLSLCILLLVLSNEGLQLCLSLDHEHLLHVSQLKAIIAAFGRPSDLIPDRILKLLNEEIVSKVRHILFLLQDFLIGALDEVGLEADWNLDVDVVVDVLLRNELNFSVILGDLIVGQQIEQVQAQNGVLPLRLANDVLKLVVVALKHADVSLELFDVFLLD